MGLERSFLGQKPLPAATHGTNCATIRVSAIVSACITWTACSATIANGEQVRNRIRWGEESTAGFFGHVSASLGRLRQASGGLVGDHPAGLVSEDITLIELIALRLTNS